MRKNMAITVNAAFSESLRETVNLESGIITVANSSLNNLINIIMSFSRNVDPFNVYSEYNLKFGSFARHTKINL